MFSSTCVLQMTGMWAASQIQSISSCSSDSLKKPASAARSPRAIMIANGFLLAAATTNSGRWFTASTVSILITSGMASAASLPTCSANVFWMATMSLLPRTKEKPRISASISATNKSSRSLSVNIGILKVDSGKLSPFCGFILIPLAFAVFPTCTTTPCDFCSTTRPSRTPSSKMTGLSTFSSSKRFRLSLNTMAG